MTSAAVTFGNGVRDFESAADFFNDHPEAVNSDELGVDPAVLAGAQHQEQTSESTAAPSGYIYGFEDLFAGRSGPVSSEELLVWLKQHSQGINEELRDRMLNADMRNKLVEDLSYLKAQPIKGNNEGLQDEANALLAAYVGTPYEEAARTALGGIINAPDESFSQREADKYTGEMQSVIDGLGKDDQMEMIYIQNLTQRLNEQFGFGSAYLSKAHDTLMSIIGNLA